MNFARVLYILMVWLLILSRMSMILICIDIELIRASPRSCSWPKRPAFASPRPRRFCGGPRTPTTTASSSDWRRNLVLVASSCSLPKMKRGKHFPRHRRLHSSCSFIVPYPVHFPANAYILRLYKLIIIVLISCWLQYANWFSSNKISLLLPEKVTLRWLSIMII